jgi:hypothetical protein
MPNSKPPARRKVGRPTVYQPRFAQIAKKCCELGATNADLAIALGVSLGTIKLWRSTIPDFAAAFVMGRDVADSVVERSLYERAVGHDHEETKVTSSGGKVFKTTVVQHVPGDVTAQRFWLANRRKREWSLTPDKRIELALGDFKGAEGLVKAMTSIAAAMARGDISAAEGEAMTRVMGAVSDNYERLALENRLAALEDKR